MNELRVSGSQKFMGKEIPVVAGGFGKKKKCVSDKTVAEIHGITVSDVRKAMGRNIKRFKDGTDYIDLKVVVQDDDRLNSSSCGDDLLTSMGYSKQQIIQAEHIYILSERGYAKLIKIMDSDLAWEIHDKLMDEYFQMRAERQALENLSPELQLFSRMFEAVAKQELEQKRQAEKLEQVDCKVDSIKEIVALRPTQWRKDSGSIINKVALSLGGYEHIRAIREESYKLLEERMGVALNIRLTNKKKTLSLNGACKSKIDKLNQLDVIADDKKLIEGYISVIKELAIKYGVAY